MPCLTRVLGLCDYTMEGIYSLSLFAWKPNKIIPEETVIKDSGIYL